jgi:hypothetical protein
MPFTAQEIREDRDRLDDVAYARKYLPNVPPWANQTFRICPDRSEMDWSDGGTQVVSLDRVVGTTNQKYGGRSWLWVLRSLSRTDTLARSVADPSSLATYLLRSPTDLHLVAMGGEYYVGQEGNHRCVVGRLLGLSTVRAQVTRFTPKRRAVDPDEQPASRPSFWMHIIGG